MVDYLKAWKLQKEGRYSKYQQHYDQGEEGSYGRTLWTCLLGAFSLKVTESYRALPLELSSS